MPWRQFWKKLTDQPEPAAAEPAEPARAANMTLPPHMQRIVAERKKPATANADLHARLARLERNRLAAIYDVEQGELASAPENPWKQRIDLLSQAMQTVEDDLARVRKVEPSPFFPLPARPITNIDIATGPVADVAFTIGDQRFRFSEDLDWAERGHQLTQSELRLREGNPVALTPADTPANLRDALVAHLDESLFVFATDLRDRTLDRETLPSRPSLTDLAKPCPVCGGWTDWQGRCQVCRTRDAEMRSLKREENRLLSERAREAEEQHRLQERLSIARRRLRDIDVEVEALRAQM